MLYAVQESVNESAASAASSDLVKFQAVIRSAASAASQRCFQAVIKSAATTAPPGAKKSSKTHEKFYFLVFCIGIGTVIGDSGSK